MPKRVNFQRPVVIAGISARTTNAREADPTTATLGRLWGRFYAQGASSSSAPPESRAVYSVYTDYESDLDGAYTVVIGRESADTAEAEKVAPIAAGSYLEFISTGPMPAAVIDGWKQVWSYFADPESPQRSYTTDFEYYDAADPSTVRIYISVA